MNKILALTVILSIILHIVTFSFLNDKVKLEKPKYNTTNKIKPTGYQNIKYVKLVAPTVDKKAKPPLEPKRINPTKSKIKPIVKEIKKPKPKPKIKKYIKVPKKIPIEKKIIKKKTPVSKPKEIIPNKELLQKKQKLQEKIDDLKTIKKLDKKTQSYIKLYGDEYFTFSKEQKQYLNNNLNNIGRVTQMYLRYPRIAVKTKQQGMNIVQFFLYPNGDIKDLKITNGSGYTTLDKNTIKTIKLAYKDYPRPEQKTKVKIYVYYQLR